MMEAGPGWRSGSPAGPYRFPGLLRLNSPGEFRLGMGLWSCSFGTCGGGFQAQKKGSRARAR